MPQVTTRLGRWFYEESAPSPSCPPDAPAIVLLHGLFFDGRMWEAQVPALAALGRVIVFDGPGHGGSDVPPAFTLEDHADALAEAFDALAVERAVVIGLSWGAMVALRFALAHPARVRALAVLGGSAGIESRRDVVAHRLAVTLGGRFAVPESVMRNVLAPLILSRLTVRERPALVDEVVRTMQSQPPEGVARASLAVVGRTRRLFDALPSIQVPALVVCGEDDRTTPVAHSRRIAAGIPRAQLTLVRACGHMTALEQPGRIRDVLTAFVAGLDRTSPSDVERAARRNALISRPIVARRVIARGH
jgi:pimeloyl-ACP methyl ester carboxylesterase